MADFGQMAQKVMRMFFLYWCISSATQLMSRKKDEKKPTSEEASDSDASAVIEKPEISRGNAWPPGASCLMEVFIGTAFDKPDATQRRAARTEVSATLRKLTEHQFPLISGLPPFSKTVDVNLTQQLETNSSMYVHVFSSAEKYPSSYRRFNLTHFVEVRPRKTKKLMESDTEPQTNQVSKWVMKWQPTLTIGVVPDWTPLELHRLPPAFGDLFELFGEQHYLPLVFEDRFWVLKKHLLEVNQSTTAVNLKLTIQETSLFKASVVTMFDAQAKSKENDLMNSAEHMDEFKEILAENNPWFLALTFSVSMLHLLFEYLAFKNDVTFWKNKKDLKGLALRTVGINCYFQLVIFLYLADSDSTSWSVLLPSGIGVLIEFWKLSRCLRCVRDPGVRFGWRIEWNQEANDSTSNFDAQATRMLLILGIPCLGLFSLYSMYNEEHKSWYSFAIKTQVRFIYYSGFVMMTPQIFINYKMKSVAHLPWKVFIYKALNTVVDDLFAFVITMPTLHRLAAFRDDVVFLILLYQRWVYPVDKARTNEFGQVGEASSEIETTAKAVSEKPKTD